MTVNLSGTNYIDSLLSFNSWTGTTGLSTTVGYSFADPQYGIPAAMRAGIVAAMGAWSSVANVTFHEVSYNVSDIDFGRGNLQASPFNLGASTLGVTYTSPPSGSTLTYEAVVIDDRFPATAAAVARGTLGYFVAMHEIGHALGLEHPGNYGQGEHAPYLPSGQDNIQNTIMSYYNGTLVTQGGNPPITPMIYDIAAIQYLYGANHSYHAANDVYAFSTGATVETIWDGGGTDTISAAASAVGARIDLREGISYYSMIGHNYIWNAFGTNLENALGSNLADTLIGNPLANEMHGNGGADIVNGLDGNDSIGGGDGNDVLYGGNGVDTIWGDVGNDLVYGNAGNDWLAGSAGNDTLYGDGAANDPSDGTDSIYGGDGNDLAYGWGGNDVLQGYIGNDTLLGGFGDDTLRGEAGNDQLHGNEGHDLMYGGDGDDVMRGYDGNDTIYGENGNDTINGEQGNDTLYGAAGNDTFIFAAGYGSDRIMDFQGAGAVGGDVIRLLTLNFNGSTYTSLADLVAHITYGGGDAHINFGGQVITLVGVGSGLTVGDFKVG